MRGVVVVGPEEALEDPDRALHLRARLLKLAELLLHDAEVSQRDRDLRVLRPVDGLLDRERIVLGCARLLKLLHALPKRLQPRAKSLLHEMAEAPTEADARAASGSAFARSSMPNTPRRPKLAAIGIS